jgi:hypothetical protein
VRFFSGLRTRGAENKGLDVSEPDKNLFSEVQRFSVLLIAPLVILFLCGIGFAGHVVFRPILEESEPWPIWAWVVSISGILINVLVTLVLVFTKLQIRLDKTALYLRFFPFHLSYKKIDFDTIATVYARTYQPLGEFGGWGIRWGASGRAYNVSGNRGVQLLLKNGKKILIGSQHADGLASLLQETMFHARLSSYAEEFDEPKEQISPSDTSLGQAV